MPQHSDTSGLQRFVAARLGPGTSEPGRLKTMLTRSFGAGSFHEFWRYWNPVYAYYLHDKCYRPLNKRFSH